MILRHDVSLGINSNADMLKNILFSVSLMISALTCLSQDETFGLLVDSGIVAPGYVLFSPEANNFTYLIDECGQKINEWEFSQLPKNMAYLLENGNILCATLDSLEIRNWNNELVWSYAMNANGIFQHHDIYPLPNGNIICLAVDNYTREEAIELGRDTTLLELVLKMDRIVELNPIGSHDAEIVWEWKIKDHLIQEFDSSKLNFGVVADHPELLDLNFNESFISDLTDWTHANSIAYNNELDQILISFRHISEVYIIDHSTTAEEAIGHTGGNSGRGGDLLWRWGNPKVYRQGEDEDQQFFKQHDARWVESGFLDEGKISVFNNFGDDTFSYSSVVLVDATPDNQGYPMENGQFSPLETDFTWDGELNGNVVLAGRKGGFQSLSNGNLLISESSKGIISEVTKEGLHIWSYKNPHGVVLLEQYSEIDLPFNYLFKAQKYTPDFPGLSFQDLVPLGTIENINLLSDSCSMSVGISENQHIDIEVVNPVKGNQIQFTTSLSHVELTLFEITGRVIYHVEDYSGSALGMTVTRGQYLLHITDGNHGTASKLLLVE